MNQMSGHFSIDAVRSRQIDGTDARIAPRRIALACGQNHNPEMKCEPSDIRRIRLRAEKPALVNTGSGSVPATVQMSDVNNLLLSCIASREIHP